MTNYIQVSEDEGEEPIELPVEDDGTLLISTLNAQFPGAVGLKFRAKTNLFRGVRLADGRFYPPENDWGTAVYYCVFLKENKRKSDDCTENLVAKTKRMDISKCTDLIVLGLPWNLTEHQLRSYFEPFGELVMTTIKRDPKTGSSKGYGFIRYAKYESQVRALASRHRIEERNITVKIPNSQESSNFASSKVFVGRITEELTAEDLHSYFSKYGEVVDVFLPKPFRAFAFVTFLDPQVALSLLGEDHIIKGVSVHIGEATPPKWHSSYGMSGDTNRPSEARSPPPPAPFPARPDSASGGYSGYSQAPSSSAGGLFNALGLNPVLLAALSQASWEWMQQHGHPPPPSSPSSAPIVPAVPQQFCPPSPGRNVPPSPVTPPPLAQSSHRYHQPQSRPYSSQYYGPPVSSVHDSWWTGNAPCYQHQHSSGREPRHSYPRKERR